MSVKVLSSKGLGRFWTVKRIKRSGVTRLKWWKRKVRSWALALRIRAKAQLRTNLNALF